MESGTYAEIWGVVVLILGGALATAVSLANTRGPRERAFVAKVCAGGWVAAIALVAGLVLIPRPFGFLLWLPFGIAVPLALTKARRHQQQIRTAEGESTTGPVAHGEE